MVHRVGGDDDNIAIDDVATDGRKWTDFFATVAAAVTTKSTTSTHIFYFNYTTTKTEKLYYDTGREWLLFH